MYKVHSNKPIPPRGAAGKRSREQKYPFARMQVGDAFFVPATPKTFKKIRGRVMNACSKWRAQEDPDKIMRFESRVLPKEKAVGIWRTR